MLAALTAPVALGLAELPWTARRGVFGSVVIMTAPSIILSVVASILLAFLTALRRRLRASTEDVGRWAATAALLGIVAAAGVYASNVLLLAPPMSGATLIGYALTIGACVIVGIAARTLRSAVARRALRTLGITSITIALACALGIACGIMDATSYPTNYLTLHLVAECTALLAFAVATIGLLLRLPRLHRPLTGVLAVAWIGIAFMSLPLGWHFSTLARHPGLQRRAWLAATLFHSPQPFRQPDSCERSTQPSIRQPPPPPVVGARSPATIVLITADTFRCGFAKKDRSPFRDACPALTQRLASARYTLDAHAVAPYTSASVASTQMAGDRPLGLQLRARGFRTSVIANHVRILEPPGIRASFDDVDESLTATARQGTGVTSEQTTARALAVLDATPPDQKLFLWVHYFDPHAPYVQDPSSQWRFSQVGAYVAEVRRTDAAVAKLVDAVRVRGRSVAIFSADHGEEFGEHGGYAHGSALYEESVRIPIAVWASNAVPDGELPAGSDETGKYVLALAAGNNFVSSRKTTMQAPAEGDQQRGIVQNGWKLIEHSSLGYAELFDLTQDPYEQDDVSEENPQRVRDLRCQLDVTPSDAVPLFE